MLCGFGILAQRRRIFDILGWVRNAYLMPRSHIHGSPHRFLYGLNRTDDPGNANFRRPIRMHYIRMIEYYLV